MRSGSMQCVRRHSSLSFSLFVCVQVPLTVCVALRLVDALTVCVTALGGVSSCLCFCYCYLLVLLLLVIFCCRCGSGSVCGPGPCLCLCRLSVSVWRRMGVRVCVWVLGCSLLRVESVNQTYPIVYGHSSICSPISSRTIVCVCVCVCSRYPGARAGTEFHTLLPLCPCAYMRRLPCLVEPTGAPTNGAGRSDASTTFRCRYLGTLER